MTVELFIKCLIVGILYFGVVRYTWREMTPRGKRGRR